MKQLGVIVRVSELTEQCSGMVVVQKQTSSGFALTWHDSTRAFAKRDPLPAVEQTLAQLLGAKILSKLDINTADTSIPW